jgi:hypothetical protein
MHRFQVAVAGVALASLSMTGCAFGPRVSGARTVNAEIRLISQSCFGGEIAPCG